MCSLVSPVEVSGAVLVKRNAIARSYIAISRVVIDIHISSGKNNNSNKLRSLKLSVIAMDTQCVCYMGKRECYYRQTLRLFFFSFSINFSPSVPSLQFLGRKETELTMQMSLCSASSYKLRVISLTTLNCRQPPFSTFWLSGSVKTALKVQLFKKTLQQHNRDVRCYI